MLHVWQSGIGKVDRSPAKSGDRTWFGNVLNARGVWGIKKRLPDIEQPLDQMETARIRLFSPSSCNSLLC